MYYCINTKKFSNFSISIFQRMAFFSISREVYFHNFHTKISTLYIDAIAKTISLQLKQYKKKK